jgi:ribosomal protein S18 acetylase RimI-like enzyme
MNTERQQLSDRKVPLSLSRFTLLSVQMMAKISLRNVTPNDEAFLLRLYGTTRPEVGLFGWDEAEQQAFIAMQFQMQARSYVMEFPNADHSVITYGGKSAGRAIVNRTPTAISLTDIAVMPEFRGKGIATTVIERLQDESVRTDRNIELTVERTNETAFHLYRRLGFEVTGESEIHLAMTWSPEKNRTTE